MELKEKPRDIINSFLKNTPQDLNEEEKLVFDAVIYVLDENIALMDYIRHIEEYKPTSYPDFDIRGDKITMDLDYYNEVKNFLYETYRLFDIIGEKEEKDYE